MKHAEIAAFFGRYDDAEKLYIDLDRKYNSCLFSLTMFFAVFVSDFVTVVVLLFMFIISLVRHYHLALLHHHALVLDRLLTFFVVF